MEQLLSSKFYKKHSYEIMVVAIILLAIFLRFYNYSGRLLLAGDQARDAIIAQEIVNEHKIPAVGPFSSVGNFTTGNIWYIWLGFSAALIPTFEGPWIILTLSYITIVILMIIIARNIGDKSFSLIVGLLAAVSPAEVAQSTNLTNPSLVAVFSVLTLLFALLYLKKGTNLFLFLVAFFIGEAISTHFQAVYLLVLIPIVLVVKRPKLSGFVYLAIGLIIPFIAYFYFDFNHNFYNIRGIIDYVRFGQYRIYIANRWLTYAAVFWPDMWGKIIGGNKLFGYLFMALVTLSTIYSLLKKQINKQLLSVVATFAIVFVALRFYRGERFDGYFVFLHPYVLLLSAFVIYFIYKLNKYLGLLILFLVLIFSINASLPALFDKQTEVNKGEYWSNVFIKDFPDKKFEFYQFTNSNESLSLPIVINLYKKGKIQDGGYRIGFGGPKPADRKNYVYLKDNKLGFDLWSLNSSSSAQLIKSGWHKANPSSIYKVSAEWYK